MRIGLRPDASRPKMKADSKNVFPLSFHLISMGDYFACLQQGDNFLIGHAMWCEWDSYGGEATSTDYVRIKYTPVGDELWVQQCQIVASWISETLS